MDFARQFAPTPKSTAEDSCPSLTQHAPSRRCTWSSFYVSWTATNSTVVTYEPKFIPSVIRQKLLQQLICCGGTRARGRRSHRGPQMGTPFLAGRRARCSHSGRGASTRYFTVVPSSTPFLQRIARRRSKGKIRLNTSNQMVGYRVQR
jgi:hypothetical protein